MTLTSTFSEPPQKADSGSPRQPKPNIIIQPDVYAEQLPQDEPPPFAEACTLHGRSLQPGQVVVINSQAALREISVHSRTNLSNELGGVLLGRAYQDNGCIYVEVLASLPAANNDHGPIHFKFTADAWVQIHRERARLHPELSIVGWFHTHPNLGVFYSGDDVVVHSAAFTLPWQAGLVVDPVRREAAFFAWHNGRLAPLPGLYELHDITPQSMMEWKVVPTAVWHHSYEPSASESQSLPEIDSHNSHTYTLPAELPEVPPLGQYVGFIAGIAGLLLSVALLFGWMLPQARQIDALQNTVLTLANQTLAASNVATCPDPHLRLLSPIAGSRIAVGTAVALIGTTQQPDALRYRLQARPVGSDIWADVALTTRATELGEIATWDTTPHLPGVYQVQLTAVDRNNIRVANSTTCQIQLELIP